MSDHRTFRTLAPLAALVAVSATFAACGSSSEATGGELSVSYSSPVESQPSQQGIIQGFEAGADDLGWSADVIDANLSADAQVSNVQTMIQQQVDGIALWTLDSGAMEGTFAQASEAGIPVIGVNSEAEQMDSSVWWALNLCESDDSPFKQAAEQIAKQRPDGKVIVMGGPPVPSIQANVECFSEAAEANGLEIVAQADNTKDTSASAASLAQDLLSQNPDVDAVWSYNDATALGVSAAAERADIEISDGTSDGVIIQGLNGDADAIEAIRQGRLTGTWDPNPVATGMAVIQSIQDAADGDGGKMYVVDSTYVDASNIDDYVAPEDRSYELDDLPVTVE